MLSISATNDWRAAHPGAIIGLLEISGLDNHGASPALNEHKREIETRLTEHYNKHTRQDFLTLPTLATYDRYYARFNKTYHVQLQLESIVLKGKHLPNVSPAVDANFMAEVETWILTAGHDAAKLNEPIVIDISRDGEQMTQMNGTPKTIRAGDMIMRDKHAISCSIIYGQDARSPIAPDTTHVLYVAYAPASISAARVEQQLSRIQENLILFNGDIIVEQHRLVTA
jgi:DNA/RNA-binding domain of Phe-tRNA-synthetase-like protein